MSVHRLGLVTCQAIPDLTADDRLLAAELLRRGIDAVPVVWDDRNTHWERFDTLVLRSCWDYHHRPQEFLQWLDRLNAGGAVVWNPASLVRWNLHKAYLRGLAAQGTAILPTVWLERGDRATLESVLAENGWTRAVVKPAVSASAYGTWVVDSAEAATAARRFDALIAQRDLLVQRFEPALLDQGEWSFVYFAGRYSHAVLKTPSRGDYRVQEEHGGSSVPHEAPPRLLEQCERILKRLEGAWLFARVDGMDLSGTFTLMELELIEPVLFFEAAPQAAARMAEAIFELRPFAPRGRGAL